MTKKLTSSDIYDINKKTGALILGKNRLDDYATKYPVSYTHLRLQCRKSMQTNTPH